MDKKRITGKYILIYSAVFLLLCAVVFAPFALDGRCLVGNGDGQSQYILQLEYMGRWLRQALGGILHGDFTPARFDFSIGMGDDITSVVRFHPLDFLAVFVPEAGTELLYQFLIFFRLYLAGIAFSAYAFAWKRMAGGDADQGQRYDSWAVLAGSMVYLFTGYTYCLGIVHPTYLSPLITLPLLLLGAERMLHREEEHRFVLFSVMTAVSFISNYYFMYIASVAAVLYVFIRFFQIYKENRIRKFVIVFVRFTAAYVTGTLIACITLLPVLKRYAGSYRSQHLTSLSNLLVYADKRRYVAWLINLISPLRASGNGTHLNYVVLVIPALILLFFVRAKGEQESGRGKERIFLRICALILLAFLLIPAGGFLLAAMNNENNRWVFLIALLCGGVVSFSFPDFFRLQKRQTTALALGCIVYDLAVAAAAVLFGYDRYPVVGAVQLTAVTLFLLLGRKAAARTLCVSLTGICAVSVMINGIMTFAKPFGNLPRYYRHAQDSLAWYRDSVYANYLKIPGTDAIGFYRVDGVFPGNREDNAALLLGYPGIQMYNSVMNPAEIDAQMKTENSGLTTMLHIRYLDGRSALEELASVRYYMAGSGTKAAIPYGYKEEPVYSDEKISIYENEYPLSLSYGVSRVMPESEYEKLTGAEREYVCLEAAVLEDEAANRSGASLLSAEEYRSALKTQTIPVSEAQTDDGMEEIIRPEGGIILKAKNKKARFRFQVPMREGYACYLSLTGVSPSVAGKIFVEAEDVSDRVTLLTEEETYTLQRSDYLVNLGIGRQEAMKEVSLRFSERGSCLFDQMNLVYIPLNGYEEKVGLLQSHAMENEEIQGDTITGSVHWEETGIQLFSIPYSAGWEAEVDGEKVPLLKADTCWMGLILEEGDHDIRLTYRTEMLRTGALCSVAGLLLLLFGWTFFYHKKHRGKKHD